MPTDEYRYQALAKILAQEIRQGLRSPGSRMPSIRQLCQEQTLSKSTVLTAYARLEAEGLIEARPRSGYFVQTQIPTTLKTPSPSQPGQQPIPVSVDQVLLDIMAQGAAFDILAVDQNHNEAPAGNEQLRRCLARAQRSQGWQEQHYYDEPQGLMRLRRALAQRLYSGGSQPKAEELVVTAGCQHALLLALMATTTAGDVVAVESPGFYGVFQLLDALGLQVLELPSSAQAGVSPEALEMALQHWRIKALVVSPSYATPTGACLPEASKQKLVQLADRYNFAIIEDDIYGELQFGSQRARTLHSYDQHQRVLLCGSFSKSLSRDLRLGWIAPGKFLEKIKQLKLITALANSATQQLGLAYFLEEGGLDRHLRFFRKRNQEQYEQLLSLIPSKLPMAVSCSQPKGGLCLWLELPDSVDGIALYGKAREQGIILTPGRLFTTQERYQSFLRVCFSQPWTQQRQHALGKLGELIEGAIYAP